MYRLETWASLILCLIGLYMFISFEDWMNKEFVDHSINSKGRFWRTVLFGIAQNKFGYWLVRCIPLIPCFIFGKAFWNGIKKK